MKKVSLIVACYNESQNIEELYGRVKQTFAKLAKHTWEIIYVDNASTDHSEKIYDHLCRRDKRVKVILMSKNFGSPQSSFLAGLRACCGQAAILLHGDIQDPPEMIAEFIKKWKLGYQVVYGVRTKRRGYGFFWNFMYKAFYFILHKFAYIDIPLDAGEFSLIDRQVINELIKFKEYDYYLRCLRAFVGFRQIGIPYERDARHRGRSTENLLTSFWWAKTILINFSFKPLEWISTLAFMVVILTLLLLVVNLMLMLLFQNSPRGIPTIVFLILFLGAIQLLSLSVIAEYLAKIFLEVKRRPRYIIKKTINL